MAFDDEPLRGLLFLFVGLVMAAAGLIRVFAWGYSKSLLASSWYTSQGRVEFGNVVERRVRHVSYFVATIHYSSSVGNEYYSGSFERVFLRESSADRFVATMKDKPVFVRSNPHRPARSALLKQDQPGGWLA